LKEHNYTSTTINISSSSSSSCSCIDITAAIAYELNFLFKVRQWSIFRSKPMASFSGYSILYSTKFPTLYDI